MLEKLIAYHCAPALAGIKPANLVSCQKTQLSNAGEEIEKLNKQLSSRGIYVEVVCECEKRVLMMVYRKSILKKHLENPEMNDFLKSFGYPEEITVKGYVDFLKNRLKKDDFPHEMGVFLGYPLHDIYGFINHRDEGCLLTGEWKVYKDAEGAKEKFKRYAACRKALARRIEKGYSLVQIFRAA